MSLERTVKTHITAALAALVAAGDLAAEVLQARFKVEQPRRPEHGDLATNVALAIQKMAKKPPRELAERIAAELRQVAAITAAEIAGPGFINLRLAPAAYQRVLSDVLAQGEGYGRAPAAIRGRMIVEFVSANPTGPLLISHGRGAMVGDAIARLLEAAGYHVSREYYINDHGNQVRKLATSVRHAARDEPPPEGGYGGAYVKELAAWMQQNRPELLADDDEGALARACVTCMLDGIRDSRELCGIKHTLANMGVEFDNWFSEESLHRWGRVVTCMRELESQGLLERRDGALFMTTESFLFSGLSEISSFGCESMENVIDDGVHGGHG